MTAQITLVTRDDFTSDIGTLSLTGYTNGIELAADGWRPQLPDDDSGRVTEAMVLRVKGTSTDDLASKEQALANMVRLTKQAKQAAERYGVWMRVQMDGETKARQAYLTDAKHIPLVSLVSPEFTGSHQINEYSFGYERMPCWEGTSIGTSYTDSIGCVGGTATLTVALKPAATASFLGDQPARVAMMDIYTANTSVGPVTKMWVGFRSPQYGNPLNFVPVWNLRKGGILGTDTTGGTINADATAQDGYKTITTFATSATLINRVLISVNNATGGSNITDQRGSFKVLLRAKNNSTVGTVRARLGDGLLSSSTWRKQSRVTISGTLWNFYDMGQVTLPSPGNYVYGTDPILQSILQIDAERVSGTCSLNMDCLVMIPNDEYSIYIPDGQVDTDGATNTHDDIFAVRPNNQSNAYIGAYGLVSSALSTPYVNGAGIPLGSPILTVCAGQQAGSSRLADFVGMALYTYERWDNLRGTEA